MPASRVCPSCFILELAKSNHKSAKLMLGTRECQFRMVFRMLITLPSAILDPLQRKKNILLSCQVSEKRTSPTPTDGQIPGDECMVTVNLCKSRMLELIYVNLVCFESNTLLSTSYSKTTKQHVQKVQVGIVYQETSYVCVFCIKCYVQPSFLLAHPLQNHKKKNILNHIHIII